VSAIQSGPQLYFIRHGETDWSRSGQHTGNTDIPLTMHGEDEARALLPWLQNIPFTGVLTSPRQRARTTCALAGLEGKAKIESDLTEWDYGDYEGLRSDEIRAQRPDWTVFRDGCPNGESPTVISDRADLLIARLLAMAGNVALFSHGQFGAVLAARWIGLPVIEGQHLALGPASLSILGHNPSHPDVRTISLWNASPNYLPSQ
jgi:broad specificity phosphatase PhoE